MNSKRRCLFWGSWVGCFFQVVLFFFLLRSPSLMAQVFRVPSVSFLTNHGRVGKYEKHERHQLTKDVRIERGRHRPRWTAVVDHASAILVYFVVLCWAACAVFPSEWVGQPCFWFVFSGSLFAESRLPLQSDVLLPLSPPFPIDFSRNYPPPPINASSDNIDRLVL